MSSLSLPMPRPAAAALPWRQLGALTVLVLLLHWGLLGGLAPLAGIWERPADLETGAFETRTITLPAPAAPAATQKPVAAAPKAPPATPAPVAEKAPAAQEAPEPTPEPPPPPPEESPGAGMAIAAGAFFTGAALAQENPPMALGVPPSVQLSYDIKGIAKGFIPYSAKGELQWSHDGKNYDARMEISNFLGARIQTSRGAITPQGLAPLRFGDKVKSEVAAHFERDKGKVSFSANTPDVPLEPGAQDHLSIFVQLAALLNANSGRFPSGTTMSFQAVGARSAETWTFKILQPETLKLPGGELLTIKLLREAVNENDARAEIWLAPTLNYLPARIRLTHDGDVVDQLWRSTQNR